MHITVLWWSWRIGGLVAQHARDAWHHVTILVRNPAKIQYNTENMTLVQWDATNVADIQKAIQDADVVVHAVSVPFSHTKPTILYSQVTQTIIDARPSSHAQKLIVMSNIGTDHIRKKMPWFAQLWYEHFLWDVADDKEREERLLEQSTLPWIIIKAPMLTNWWVTQYSMTPFETYTFSIFHHISRKTVAKAMIDIATSDTQNKKIVLKTT